MCENFTNVSSRAGRGFFRARPALHPAVPPPRAACTQKIPLRQGGEIQAACLQNVNYYAVAAQGKSNVLFAWSFYKWGMLLLLLLIGMHWGMYGILCGMVISELNIYLVNAALVAKYVSYPVWRQLLDILPILLVALVTCVTVYVMGNTWHIHLFLL